MIPTPTLASKLGTTTHLSPLLHKARRLGLDGEKLQILAVQRGCDHYRTGDEPETPLASLKRGLKQAATARGEYLGSFAKHAADE